MKQDSFDKEGFKNDYRKLMSNWTEEQLEDYVEEMEDKYRAIKHGENVVHLHYFARLLNDDDINELEKILSTSNLQLSRFDKSGILHASVEDLMLQVALCLNEKITQDILIGLTTSALWDAIKTTVFYVWRAVRGQRQRILTSQTSIERKINCGIKVSLDKNTKFEFKIDGDLSEETVLKSLDNVLEFLKAEKSNTTTKRDDFVTFNTESNSWEIIGDNAKLESE